MWTLSLDQSSPLPEFIDREKLCRMLTSFCTVCDQLGPTVEREELDRLHEAVTSVQGWCPALASIMAEQLHRAIEGAWAQSPDLPY